LKETKIYSAVDYPTSETAVLTFQRRQMFGIVDGILCFLIFVLLFF